VRLVYRKLKPGAKYILGKDITIQTRIKPKALVKTEYLRLTKAGLFTIKAGNEWDGASGPVKDDETNMRSSLFHDGGYKLLRLGKLSYSKWKKVIDKLYRDMSIEDGAEPRRAKRHYRWLRRAGRPRKPAKGDKVEWITIR
jgi:hypothetical protein